jgi:uncharacterized membrane protein
MAKWTLVSNHGGVLAMIKEREQVTLREIAGALDLTERSVHRIVADLVEAGYVVKDREGRSNRYDVKEDLPVGHPLRHDVRVGDLLKVLTD